MENNLYFILVLLFVLLEGFFSCAELTFISTSKYYVNLLAEKRKILGRILLKSISLPERILTTTLVGTNLFMILAASFFSHFLINLHIPHPDILSGILIVPFIFFFGEVGPKFIGRRKAKSLAPFLIPAVWNLSYVFYPLSLLVGKTRAFLEKVLGLKALKRSHTREDMAQLVETAHFFRLGPFEKEGLKTLMEIKTERIENIMIPISRAVLLEKKAIDENIIQCFKRYGFSRYPVYEDLVYNIIGVISVYDYLRRPEGTSGISVMRPPVFIPENSPLMNILKEYAEHKEEMMIVVDEFGGCTGIVTLKDFWGELVGAFGDEHVHEKVWIEIHEGNRFVVRGDAKVETLNDEFGLDIEEGEYSTIAGFLMEKMGRIPQKGETFRYKRLKFTVLESTRRYIEKVEIVREG